MNMKKLAVLSLLTLLGVLLGASTASAAIAVRGAATTATTTSTTLTINKPAGVVVASCRMIVEIAQYKSAHRSRHTKRLDLDYWRQPWGQPRTLRHPVLSRSRRN